MHGTPETGSVTLGTPGRLCSDFQPVLYHQVGDSLEVPHVSCDDCKAKDQCTSPNPENSIG